jgi:hypothetical protein
MPDVDIATAILAAHFIIIAFNVLGLFVIPLGAWLRWRFVRIPWLRLLHLGLLAVVAAQALMGRACILTIWQNELTGGTAAPQPMIMHWLDGLIYYNLPIWVFSIIYTAVFLYVVVLSILVPFGRRHPP